MPELVEAAANSTAPVVVVSKNVGHFGSFDVLRKTVMDIRGRLGDDKPVIVALAGVNEDDKPVIAVATNEAARKAAVAAASPISPKAAVPMPRRSMPRWKP